MDNADQRAPQDVEVQVEPSMDTVEDDGLKSREPDYLLRANGFPRFIVEAKKPAVDIDTDKKATPAQRTKCMAAIRGKNTTPERIVRSGLHRLGCRFALHRTDLPGKPDVVMPARGLIVLVHGCYWHMHTCKRGRSTPATNAAFWRTKRNRNRARDHRTLAALRRAGWRVLVVWECQARDPAVLAAHLATFLKHR